MSPSKRKYAGEPFNLVDLHVFDNNVSDGYFYYCPKIVGINFKSREGHSRAILVKDFLFYKNQVQLLPGREAKDYIISLIQLSKRTDQISRFIELKPEPNNKYDPNAMCIIVFNKGFGRFHDVGYLPKEHVGLIKKRKLKYFLIGAKPDGKGLRLDIILCKDNRQLTPAPLSPLSEKKSVSRAFSEFLTLKEMREQLVVRR